MAGPQVNRIIYAGNPAVAFDLHHPIFEEPLTAPRYDEGFTLGRRNGSVPVQLRLDVMFPKLQIGVGGSHRLVSFPCLPLHADSLGADQSNQSL